MTSDFENIFQKTFLDSLFIGLFLNYPRFCGSQYKSYYFELLVILETVITKTIQTMSSAVGATFQDLHFSGPRSVRSRF